MRSRKRDILPYQEMGFLNLPLKLSMTFRDKILKKKRWSQV